MPPPLTRLLQKYHEDPFLQRLGCGLEHKRPFADHVVATAGETAAESCDPERRHISGEEKPNENSALGDPAVREGGGHGGSLRRE